jgi:hypothetical protein
MRRFTRRFSERPCLNLGAAVIMGMVALQATTPAACAETSETIRQYQFEPAANGYRLALKEVPRPTVGASR